jgi:localization factor PodJL
MGREANQVSAAAPWSVKGIDPKAREIAKDLARRSGMTLGEWLNSMIMEDEDDGVVPLGRRPHAAESYERRGRSRRLDDAYQMEERGWDRLGASVDAIAARLEAAERRSTTAIQGVDQAVTGLLRRLDEQDKAAAALNRRMDDVAEELREGHRRLRRFEQETGPSTQEAFGKVEKGLQAITGRLLEVEDRQGRTAEDLRRRIEAVEKSAPGAGAEVLGEVGRRLDAAQNQTADALRRLEASFAQLDRRLHAAESRVEPEGAREAARFEKLAETLSRQVEANRAEMMRRMDAAEAEGRMDRIERAVLAIGDQVKSSEQKSAQGIEAMGREVLRIGQNLHGRMQVVEQQGARQAQALEQRQAAAEDRHALALEKLGVEITRISDRLTDRIAQSERKSAQAIEEIGRRLADGAGRIEQRYDRASGELAERMRQSEERTARLLAEAREAMETRTAAAPAPKPAPVPEPTARPDAVFAPIPEAPIEPAPVQADWRAAAFPDVDLGLDDPFTAPAEPSFEPLSEAAARPFAAPLEPTAGGPFGAATSIAAEPHSSPEAPPPGPFGRAAAGGFGGADVSDALAATAPDMGHEEFAAETDFVDPRALRAAAQAGRASSTRAAIDQARAAMAAPAADDAPARGAFGLKKGGKSRLQERLDRQSQGSTVRKALGASAIAVALTGGLYGFARVQGIEAPWAALTGVGAAEATPTTLALATTDAAPVATPDQLAEGARLFDEALAALDADDQTGVETLRRAAELGHPPAQLMMAGLYETGDAGLASDMTEARRWIRRAAESGDARGMFGYGMYLFEGQGGPQDRAAGFDWILKAAEAGLVDAQFNAGLILKTGEAATEADPVGAYRWLLIAARGGDVQAREEGQALAPTLTEAQRAEARQAAADFQTGAE